MPPRSNSTDLNTAAEKHANLRQACFYYQYLIYIIIYNICYYYYYYYYHLSDIRTWSVASPGDLRVLKRAAIKNARRTSSAGR
mmetsp:Transcript_27162/g.44245  ORF Transcript_27162/g.44245 Transcript_27162/m.44245 type:complete len:83 (+) Transcript_27162:1043-1291(+)